MVKVPHLYCRGCRFNPWSRNLRPHMMLSAAKKKKKKERDEELTDKNPVISSLI